MASVLSAAESALLHLVAPPDAASPLVRAACAAESGPVLTSDLARSVFRLARDDGARVQLGVRLPAGLDGDARAQEDVLALAVAALHAYAQVNWTGPSLALAPADLFAPEDRAAAAVDDGELNDAAIDQLALAGEPVYHLSKSTAFLALALQLLGLVPSPFDPTPSSSSASASPANALPTRPYGLHWATHLESLAIWRLRAGIMWLKVLDEPVPLPAFVPADAAAVRVRLAPHSSDRASVSLSLSLLASLLSRASPHSTAQKEATVLAQSAASEAQLEWDLTGRMGKKTKWQVDEKTQLVVLARDGTSDARKAAADAEKDDGVDEAAAKIPEVLALNDDTLLEKTAFTAQENQGDAKPVGTDLSSLDPADQPHISPFSQAVLLSLSLATLPAPTSLMHLSADVLSTSQISAFVARVLDDPQNWSVHSMALLLRCRGEAGRSRTVERGVLQMQALVDQLKDGSPTEISAISSAVKAEDMAAARDRLAQFHALALPPAWEMERELAVRYMSLGIVKSALEIFTRLELWEEVARCWMTLERPDRGVDIIRELLEGQKAESDVVMNARKGAGARTFKGGEKREAKLWCTLGELERKPEHYERAWDVSGHSSSRAQRSLGAVYFSQNEWAKARDALRLALAINPLFPRTWFMLGCCEMRLEDWAGAQEAFGRCVGLENEDAESWSNLASCHLRRGELEGDKGTGAFDEDLDEIDEGIDSTGTRIAVAADAEDEEAAPQVKLPFSRKRAAFQCLRQAIKHSFDSWRLWYNYMVVAMDVGELSEACRALARMVGMRVNHDGENAVDLEVLEKLVDAVTRGHDGEDSGDANATVNPNVGRGLYRPVEHLISNSILPHVSNSPRVFLAQARLALWQGDYALALDAHLKAYRAAVVGNEAIEHDRAAFVEAVERVETVVTMLENLGEKEAKDGSGLVAKDWKFQARSLVRTFLGRTKDAFADEPEYERLKDLVKELR
ncbi:tetratricopeptide repeat-containing protein EMW1 [Rhodotorula paludigena]|uniref:tetratricopeptide repeat-containing protein EMW1 n=1 Tax=Rhodotorula paludigena TaxID=86838 RepID=UPI00317DC925